MIPVTVISLKNSTNRRKFMQRQLDAMGIPFQFFDAVDGRTLSKEILDKVAPQGGKDYCGLLSPAEIGCALSHLEVLSEIADGDYEFVAVLEDDVIINQSAHQFFDEYVLRSILQFDVIRLEDTKAKKIKIDIGSIENTRLYASPRLGMGMAGIIYTKNAAKKVIQSIEDITGPIDNMIFMDKRPKSFRVIEVSPSVAEPNIKLDSIIGSRKKPKGFAVKLRREFMRIKNQLRYWRDFILNWWPNISSIYINRTSQVPTANRPAAREVLPPAHSR